MINGQTIAYRWVILFTVCFGLCSIYINMIVYTPILEVVSKQLQVDMGQATNLLMGFGLAASFVLMWGGVICDKLGLTVAVALGMICSSLPTLIIFWIGDNYHAVFLSRLVQGAAVGFVLTTIGPILTNWFPVREQGIASGILSSAISIGSAVGVFASPIVLGLTQHWENTIFLLGLPGWVALVFALVLTRKKPPVPSEQSIPSSASGTSPERIRFFSTLTYPITWIGTIVVFCYFWCLICLYNLIPPYLAASAPLGIGLGPSSVGRLSIAVTIVGAFAVISGGIFFDKIAKGNAKVAAIAGFLLSAAFTPLILIPSVSGNSLLLVVVLMIAGGGVPFMLPSLNAFVVMNYPPEIAGRMIGWWFGLGSFGGAVGLYLGGVSISQSGNFNLAIGQISIVAVIGILFSLFLTNRSLQQR